MSNLIKRKLDLTPKEKSSSEQYIVLNKLCESILNADKEISFAAVINEMGRMLHNKSDMGIIGRMSIPKQEMFFMEYLLRQNMRKEFDDDFGAVRYTYVEREKKMLFTFPLDNHLIIVECGSAVNPVSISSKIISIIDEYKVNLGLVKNTGEKIRKIIPVVGK